MKRATIHTSAAIALLLGLAACTQDELADDNRLPEGEYPVVIRATGLSVEATPQAAPSTRATVDGDWQGVTSVALKTGDAVKEYTVTASTDFKSATLSRENDPHYWTSRDPITVSAWWPFDNADITHTAKVTNDEVPLYFDKNLEVLKTVISCAEKAAKIRKAEEKAKTNLLTKQKFSFDSNGKLANCESRDASKCEIFIVEGDSAGGSAKMARNRMFQAIMPIRGKILNVEKASIDKVLANAEIKTMINAFGCGFSEGYGNDFDITKLRYDKIIIMADADVDGAHISTLLLTLFFRFMPELILEGHVYVAMPPLYKAIPSKGEEKYLYDDAELDKYRKTHTGKFTLQRYKGLGEMDADQLWDTTLNPATRMLKRIEIEDGRLANDVTSLLMGSDVPPRKEFIYEHAHDAELDV